SMTRLLGDSYGYWPRGVPNTLPLAPSHPQGTAVPHPVLPAPGERQFPAGLPARRGTPVPRRLKGHSLSSGHAAHRVSHSKPAQPDPARPISPRGSSLPGGPQSPPNRGGLPHSGGPPR